MTRLKKIWRFASSMKFAVILLLVLAAACTAGSFVTQGQSYDWYAQNYSETAAAAIKLFGLDDTFHSWWFTAITLFLCLNLLLCNVLRLPSLIAKWKTGFRPENRLGQPGDASAAAAGEDARQRVLRLFAAMGFADENGRGLMRAAAPHGEGFYSVRQKAGIWGAWICHLGILILIAGFGLGQVLKQEYAVYGVPGQSGAIGDTGCILTIDDFRIGLREDDTVEQYTADLTVRNAKDGTSESAQVSVNHPASMYGMKFYQNSTGWAASVTILRDGEEIQKDVLCESDYLEVEDKPGLIVRLNKLYPDYAVDDAGKGYSATSEPANPAYLYQVFYQDQVIGMNVLTGDDVITIDEYTVSFSDPQTFTLIQIKRDPFTPMALVGGLLIIIGLLLAFYVQPKEMWAWQEAGGSWRVAAASRKGGALFADQFREKCAACGMEQTDDKKMQNSDEQDIHVKSSS